ncbi:integral membrane protein PTH11 [Fusarium beomiforme]|uniref:Integral membrane protein PTH11 n=1 Tax=Fusarium beomiforme TaxID=44412 RepID=A0A9P5AN22_9HYPO|nr:integral membrane protein PTH11 [Fusarium beomiforme]
MAGAPTIEPRGLGLAQFTTCIVFLILTTIVVPLRTWIRVKNKVFGLDDTLMAIGYVGQRDAVLPEGIYPYGRKFIWLFQLFYCASLVFIKASICDALLRIAVVPWHRAVAWITLAMSVACALITFIALPALMLYKTQMKLATKVSISMVLGLGALASVATIIRMPYVLFYFHPNPDYLYRHCYVSLWSIFEAGIGIIAGSLPALRKVVKRWIKFDSSARQSSASKPYIGSHGLGITSHIGTSNRAKGFDISRDVENGGKDHWDGLDDGSSRRGIVVTVDMEMHTMENNSESIGSRVSDETYARPA